MKYRLLTGTGTCVPQQRTDVMKKNLKHKRIQKNFDVIINSKSCLGLTCVITNYIYNVWRAWGCLTFGKQTQDWLKRLSEAARNPKHVHPYLVQLFDFTGTTYFFWQNADESKCISHKCDEINTIIISSNELHFSLRSEHVPSCKHHDNMDD